MSSNIMSIIIIPTIIMVKMIIVFVIAIRKGKEKAAKHKKQVYSKIIST